MRTIYITGLMILPLIVGCDFHVSNGKVPKRLEILKDKFGVEWPADYTNAQGGSLTDDRGDSDILVKLEITESNYKSWSESTTNVLRDFGFFLMNSDPKFQKYFSWWDCNSLPLSQLRVLAAEPNNPNGDLYVFVFITNNTATLYIQGSPR